VEIFLHRFNLPEVEPPEYQTVDKEKSKKFSKSDKISFKKEEKS